MNLVELPLQHALANPDRIALIDGREGRERSTSYAHFRAQVYAAVATWQHLGVGSGDRVLVLIPMRSELYVTLAALWYIGATAVFLDPSAGRKVIRRCCEESRPQGLIGIPAARLPGWWHTPLRRIPFHWYWPWWGSPNQQETLPSPPADLDPDHPAILTFTSGSTGFPKGAIRSHGLLLAQYHALVEELNLQAGETDLATLPVFTLINLAAGLTTLIPDAKLSHPGFIKPEPVLRQIQRFSPSRCVASPAFLQRLAEGAPDPSSLQSLRTLHTGGAPVSPRTLDKLAGSFQKADINVLYGSTEAEPISSIALTAISEKDRQSIRQGAGLPVGNIASIARVRILPDRFGQPLSFASSTEFETQSLAPGQAGEILVSGPHVIPGYLNGHGDEAHKVMVDSVVWHRTGDAGYLDEEGRLWLLGRCSARLDLNGRTIYPFSIEIAAVEAFDCSLAACLIVDGKPVLCLPPGTKPPDLPWSGPIPINDIRILPLPLDKRHNAKIDYTALRKMVR
ncbi:MAG: AMP-binding protein [Opitutales bacterium]|nr:AMP-binding protein [Opitutales bacterium]MCH8540445.1 AMP-binding protein [Opitutales bacterium]